MSKKVSDCNKHIHPEDCQRVNQVILKAIAEDAAYRVEFRMKHKNGSWVWIESSGRVIEWDNKTSTPIRLCGTHQDITQRYIAQQKIEQQHIFLQSIIDGIHDSVMVIDKGYEVKLMNKTVRKLIDPGVVADSNHPKCYELSHFRSTPCDGDEHICPLTEAIKTKKNVTVIHNHRNFQGENRYLELSSTPLWDQDNQFIGVIESARDITAHLQVQDELREQKNILSFQANHDALTNLPNRLLLSDRLNQAIKKAFRNNKEIALLFIDLDHFKQINDSLGHNVGDKILIETARRLKSCVRDTDTVARLGGDEFTIIVDDIDDDNDIVVDIATKIIKSLQLKFIEDEHELYVTSSIGISLFPSDAQTAEHLLRNADTAMYKAKDSGRNNYHFYTHDMTQKAFEHIMMENNLRHALSNNELTVYYQPQVNGKTNKIIGMEALVRWLHPELGLILPPQFIPLAEKTGLIISLGEQIFDIATQQMASWMLDQEQKYNFSGRLAINISVKQLQHRELINVLSSILIKNNCKAQWIEIEITENYVMDNPELAISTLQKLQDMGINIAIDDFGTGYSSLSYLKRLPINKLKIDQSFIKGLMDNEDDRVIVSSTISLAKNMQLNVIAEGVETKEQQDFILEQGCELIQGYYYSDAVDKKEMSQLLRSKELKTL